MRGDVVKQGRSLIAVIGIDAYAAWPRLDNAVSDATGVLSLFEQLGFERAVPPLLDGDATGPALRKLVIDDLAKLSPSDSLVLFFAGHGHTHSSTVGITSVQTGYVIPVDAARPGEQVAS
jgi:hypothetical protein